MRYHYLDALRSVLMILGVFYHAAMVYAPGEAWRVQDAAGHPFFNYVVNTLHAFRMPAFFMIAGFFALFSLERYGGHGYLKNRVQRLLIPFASTLLLVNSVQAIYSDAGRMPGSETISGLIGNIASGHLNGSTVSHLWFLSQLLLFSLLLLAGWRLGQWITVPACWRARGQRAWRFICDRGLFLLVMPLFFILTLLIRREAQAFYDLDCWGGLEGRKILPHLPFFVFGALMFRWHDLYRSVFKIRDWWTVVFVIAVFFVYTQGEGREITPRNVIHAYSEGLIVWTTCFATMILFSRVFNRPSRFFAYLSDASYTIYLFHHLLVILFGSLLLSAPVSCFLKYPLVLSGTLLAALAIHHFLILRSPLLRLLFNGKYQKGFTFKAPAGALGTAAAGESLSAPSRS